MPLVTWAGECLAQCLQAGHDVTVLVRTPDKLPAVFKDRIRVVQGDGLVLEDVSRALPSGTHAIPVRGGR